MATFSTFIAWSLLGLGLPYLVVFPLAVALSFAGGFLVERAVFKPIENAPVLTHIVVFVALLAIFNSAMGYIWDFSIKSVDSPFPAGPFLGSNLISNHQAGMVGITLVVLVLLWAFFSFTRVGLAMRAALDDVFVVLIRSEELRDRLGKAPGIVRRSTVEKDAVKLPPACDHRDVVG